MFKAIRPAWYKRPRHWLQVQSGNCQYRECEAWAYGPQWSAYAWGCLGGALYRISKVFP